MTDAEIEAGRCDVCGHIGAYNRVDAPTRESYWCAACNASLRYRMQARALAATLGRATLEEATRHSTYTSLDVYEPGIIGPLRPRLERAATYCNSYFWPGVQPGRVRNGVRCEDLHALTYADESFDLIVSSDIFEHVRHPDDGFGEIRRVLRRGGWHVFTVPLTWPLPSTTVDRVDTSGDEDVFLLKPQYHGSPADPEGSLVYTDFGMDLPERLRELGFSTVTHHGYRGAVTFVARKC